MAGENFKFNFITNGKGEKSIDEPVGFDSVPFTFKQDSKRYARDVFFGGDNENQFSFYRRRNHYIEELLYDLDTTGWQSEVKLIIEKDGIDNIIGDLDFQYATTDGEDEFKCKVIQDNRQQRLKRRSELKVNVFSESDIDGNEFSGLSTDNVLIKSKPIFKKSTWGADVQSGGFTGFSSGFNSLNRNYFKQIEESGIEDSLTNFKDLFRLNSSKRNPTNQDINYFKYIDAKDNLTNVKLNISDLKITYLIPVGDDINDDASRPDGVRLHLSVYVGTDENPKELLYANPLIGGSFAFDRTVKIEDYFDDTTITGDSDKYDFTLDNFDYDIGAVPRGYGIYLYINHARYNTFIKWNDGEMNITSSTITYNTVAPSIRLIDAIKQVTSSISDLKVDFPFADIGGEMYNQRIFNGNLLRGLTDRAFNLTFDDFIDWLQEINGDYQVQDDGTVYFGLYEDFYTSEEVAEFVDEKYQDLQDFYGYRFTDYEKSLNPRYAINQFTYKYKKYLSQKENESENTFDISHGESQWFVQNDYVENKKEVSVPFVRDYFYIDSQVRKAINLNSNTSTQDDDTVFILDTLESDKDLSFTETDFLQHTYDEDRGQLKISNTGNFNFISLGLRVDEFFLIGVKDINAGTYRIKEISKQYIYLEPVLNVINNNGDGQRVTEFTYTVSKETVQFISWSNEDFDYIDGIEDTENYGNLKYTVKRNIERFYGRYLATCNFWSKKPIRNTEYKNKGDLSLSFKGYQTIENANFTPENPILIPFLHKITLITDFNTFIKLQKDIKTKRGYITTISAKGHVLKLYPKEATFVNYGSYGELSIIGEEKFELSLINIVSSNLDYLIVNDEYRLNNITYRIEDNSVYIMNESGRLLYNPVFWQKVTVNGVASSSIEDLELKLKLLI